MPFGPPSLYVFTLSFFHFLCIDLAPRRQRASRHGRFGRARVATTMAPKFKDGDVVAAVSLATPKPRLRRANADVEP